MTSYYETNEPAGNVNVYFNCGAGEHQMLFPAKADGLAAALRRNVYGTVSASEKEVAALTAYVRAQAARLEAQVVRGLLSGQLEFGAPPRDGAEGVK